MAKVVITVGQAFKLRFVVEVSCEGGAGPEGSKVMFGIGANGLCEPAVQGFFREVVAAGQLLEVELHTSAGKSFNDVLNGEEVMTLLFFAGLIYPGGRFLLPECGHRSHPFFLFSAVKYPESAG